MDVNTLRTVLTLACFAAFVGIVLWAYSGARRDRFAEAANVPLLEDAETPAAVADGEGARK